MNRIVVGAHYGLMDWLSQRVTGLVMAAYALLIAVVAMGGGLSSREAWQVFMANGFVRYLSFLFIVSLCYHAWVGVRDIWMDYLNSAALRLIFHILTLFALVGYAGWAAQIIWRL